MGPAVTKRTASPPARKLCTVAPSERAAHRSKADPSGAGPNASDMSRAATVSLVLEVRSVSTCPRFLVDKKCHIKWNVSEWLSTIHN